MSTETKFQQIDKEAIAGLHFPDEEILHTSEEVKLRHADLQRALSLGNLEYTKIKIYFRINFSLICFQRLFFINVATRLCLRSNNRYTRGLRNSVLSY